MTMARTTVVGTPGHARVSATSDGARPSRLTQSVGRLFLRTSGVNGGIVVKNTEFYRAFADEACCRSSERRGRPCSWRCQPLGPGCPIRGSADWAGAAAVRPPDAARSVRAIGLRLCLMLFGWELCVAQPGPSRGTVPAASPPRGGRTSSCRSQAPRPQQWLTGAFRSCLPSSTSVTHPPRRNGGRPAPGQPSRQDRWLQAHHPARVAPYLLHRRIGQRRPHARHADRDAPRRSPHHRAVRHGLEQQGPARQPPRHLLPRWHHRLMAGRAWRVRPVDREMRSGS